MLTKEEIELLLKYTRWEWKNEGFFRTNNKHCICCGQYPQKTHERNLEGWFVKMGEIKHSPNCELPKLLALKEKLQTMK